MLTDAELLHCYTAERSESAFNELVARHLNLVYRAALRQVGGGVYLAQDVTQTVFTMLAVKAPSLSPNTVLAGWLYFTTHYTVANALRSERRRKIREQEAHLMHSDSSGSTSNPDWDRLRPVLDDAMQSLSRSDREAILLRFFEDRPYAEIGATLRMTGDAARMRVDRALEKLRSSLGKRGIASTTVALGIVLVNQASIAAPAGLASSVTQRAMVQSAGSGTPAAGLLHFMTTSKTAFGVASLFAFLAIGSAVYESWQDRASNAELASFQNEYGITRRHLETEQRQATEAEQTVAELKKSAQAPVQPSNGASNVQPAVSARDPRATGNAFLARHPEVKKALIEYIDATIHARYDGLYRSLGFTPEQIQQFEVLMRPGHFFGRSLEAGTVSLSPADDISSSERDAGLKALLGDDGIQQFATYSRAIPARAIASNLASLLIETDAPLGPDQAQQISDIFTNTADRRNSAQFNWDSALLKAKDVLSDGQLAMLHNLRIRAQGWQQVLDASR